jgi:hypothetical protein
VEERRRAPGQGPSDEPMASPAEPSWRAS